MPPLGTVRRAPARLAGLNSNKGNFRPIPRPAAKPADCCESPKYETIEGAKICINCGTQISESNIVAEVTFGETSTGAATVQGGFIGDNARHAKTLGAAAARRIGGGFQSREETESNGRQELRALCPRLHIPADVEEVAFNLWKLAAGQNFIQGRRTDEVAACCLYAACRRDKHNTILLMDISEILRVNVFKLGDVFKELSKSLFLEVHGLVQAVVEVEPLLMKYASKLEFGDKTRQVAEDAARIVKRMKRDWMVTGRHPAGLCGACIILAARMNNFRRSVREVVYVVKVADITIGKRLEEFKRTRSSQLTVDEFRSKSHRLKFQHDPPSRYDAEIRKEKLLDKMRRREERKEARRTVDISDDGSNASSRQSSLAPTPEPLSGSGPPKKRHKTNAQGQVPAQPQVQSRRIDADGFAIPDLPIDPALLPTRPAPQNTATNTSERAGSHTSTSPSPAPDTEAAKKRGRPKKKAGEAAVILTDADFAEEDELEGEIEEILQDRECISSRNDTEREKIEDRATAVANQQKAMIAAETQKRREEHGMRAQIVSDSEIIGEDEFADDPEVMNSLLSEAQVRVKEKIWVAHNEDWLRAQQAKQLKRALDEAEGRNADKRQIKRRKRSRMGDGTVLTDGGTPVESPADAATRMLEKRAGKTWSKRIDYASLNRILGNKRSTPSDSQGGSDPPTPVESHAGSREQTPAASGTATLPAPPTTQIPAGTSVQSATTAQDIGDGPSQATTQDGEGADAEEIGDEEEEEDVDEDDEPEGHDRGWAVESPGYDDGYDDESDYERATEPLAGLDGGTF